MNFRFRLVGCSTLNAQCSYILFLLLFHLRKKTWTFPFKFSKILCSYGIRCEKIDCIEFGEGIGSVFLSIRLCHSNFKSIFYIGT